jgi:DNA polymerase V
MKTINKNRTKKAPVVSIRGSTQGGRRPGAGRPKGSGKYGEPTIAIRVPMSWALKIQTMLLAKQKGRTPDLDLVWSASTDKKSALPLFGNKIAAGFPSPADDHVETALDLNEYLVEHPAATFYVRVSGESMLGAGIHPNDILVVDRSLQAVDGKIVIASLDGDLTVKRLKKRDGKVSLMPENPAFRPIPVTSEMDCHIWGVVTSVIHQV